MHAEVEGLLWVAELFNFEFYLKMMHELQEAASAVRSGPNTENMSRYVQLVTRCESSGIFLSEEARDFYNDVKTNLQRRRQAEQQF